MALETRIHLFNTHDLEGAVFIEGSPTAGAAGILAANYLKDVLNGVLVGEVVSPHFPQISIIDEEGIASRPKLELYLVNAKGVKLLVAGRAFPVEGTEGSYEVASKLYEFFRAH
ncbi:MAG: PAC2 family protein, partial [Candidatus Caldarchaeum sp.]